MFWIRVSGFTAADRDQPEEAVQRVPRNWLRLRRRRVRDANGRHEIGRLRAHPHLRLQHDPHEWLLQCPQ